MTTATINAPTETSAPKRSRFQAFLLGETRARKRRESASEAYERAEKYRALYENLQKETKEAEKERDERRRAYREKLQAEIADLKEARQILVDALRRSHAESTERGE